MNPRVSDADTPPLRLLGEVSLHVRGNEMPIGGAVQRGLLAYLVLLDGATVPTSTVLSEVWGEGYTDATERSMATLLSRLRKVTQPLGWSIDRSGGTCRLRTDGLTSDVAAFRAAVTAALDAEVASPRMAASLFEQALGHWRGEPLTGVTAPFAERERLRLTEERRVAEDRLIDVLARTGRTTDAVSRLESAVAETPFDEQRWAQLIEHLHRLGRPRDALQAYQRARRLLRDHLGLEPGARLRALEFLVLERTESSHPITAPVATSRFAGRFGELLQVHRATTSLPQPDQPVLAVIRGPSGIGKSRLVDEATATHPATRCWVACDPGGIGTFDTLLHHLTTSAPTEALDPDDPVVADLVRLTTAGTAFDPEHLGLLRRRLDGAFSLAARAAAADRGLLLVIDDAQWIDDATRTALDHWLGSPRPGGDHGVAIVVTVRDSPPAAVDEWLRALAAHTSTTEVVLGPLDEDASEQLLRSFEHLAEARVDEALRLGGGHPFTLVELARVATATERGDPLPGELDAIVDRRLDSLGPTGDVVVAGAAVLGAVDPEAIAEATDLPIVEVAVAIDRATDLGVLVDDATDGHRFAHSLFAARALARIGTTLAGTLHTAFARRFERLGQPERSARHALGAGASLPLDDRTLLVLSGARAALDQGHLDAARRYLQALDSLESPVLDPLEFEVLLGSTLLASGEVDEGVSRLNAARAAATEAGRWDLVADALRGASRAGLPTDGEDVTALRATYSAVLDGLDPADLERRAHVVSARFHLDSPRTSEASTDLAELERIASVHTSVANIARVCRYRFRVEHDTDAAVAVTAGSVLAADLDRRGDRIGGTIVRLLRAAAATRSGEPDVVGDLGAVRTAAAEFGWTDFTFTAAAIESLDVFASRPLDEAELAATEVTALGADLGHPAAITTGLFHNFAIRREHGRATEFLGIIRAVGGAADHPIAGALTLAALPADAPSDDVTELCERTAAELDVDWDLGLAAVAAIVVDESATRGAPLSDHAVDTLNRALLPVAGQMCTFASAGLHLGPVDTYLGLLSQRRGDHDAALDRYRSALELAEEAEQRLWTGWTRARESLLRRDLGDSDAADRLLVGARRDARWVGSQRLLDLLRARGA